MKIRFPFRNLEPTFFSGLLDDPLLLVRVRSAGQNLLFDCGQLHHLAKRVLTALKVVFISHTHMDHWMGIDGVIRHLHASPRTLDLFGPPGLADKFAHKLAGYDWNLAEAHWASFRVQEIYPDHIKGSLFEGPESFRRTPLADKDRAEQMIFEDRYVSISAISCEHRVPSLVYRLDEQPTFLLDPAKLEEQNLVPGPWLGELKKYYFSKPEKKVCLDIQKRVGETVETITVSNLDQLLDDLQRPQHQASIGYISDIGFTKANQEKVTRLMQGINLLVCECTFLSAAMQKARTSFHLCTEDINQLLADIKPDFFLPMHLSKSYTRHIDQLYQEFELPVNTTLLTLPARRTARPLKIEDLKWSSSS